MRTLALVLGLGLAFAVAEARAQTTRSHGISTFGELKYPADFEHFDYANPDAPKGGTLVLGSVSAFDSLNPFIVKGTPAYDLDDITYDTLLRVSQDETGVAYGLLAESVELPRDRSWVAFRLREEALWHDGRAVTPEDVIFTYEILKKKGHPRRRALYQRVASVEKTDARTVRFNFKGAGNRDMPYKVGTRLHIMPEHYWSERDFSATTLEPPLTSGPYRIVEVRAKQQIIYERVPDYWARDLPVNRGRFNFDRIQIDIYRDDSVMREAFKAGAMDIRVEGEVKDWMESYDIDAARAGRIVKFGLTSDNPKPMIAYALNMRRLKFQDPRVRRAINLAYDFEWMNKKMYFGVYTRTDSYFDISELAAPALPSPAERAILERFAGELPPELFTEPFRLPVSDATGYNRKNLLEASRLLDEAGWVIRDGVRTRVGTGEKLTMEFLISSPGAERQLPVWLRNLERIGIDTRATRVDATTWQFRRENFDFDLIWVWWSMSATPGAELRSYFGSAAAASPGGFNLAGIKSPVVDELIEIIAHATDREEFVAAVHALDRVLLWGDYVVPLLHKQTLWILYWNRLAKLPRPKYESGFPFLWWYDREKTQLLGLTRDWERGPMLAGQGPN